MATVQVAAQLSMEELLRAVGQLAQQDLEQFMLQILVLRARQQSSALPQDEAELLLKINNSIPPGLQDRYNELIGKREEEMLAPEEGDELILLTDQIELLEAARVRNLGELARLRKTTLTALMKDLGITKA